MNKFVNPTSVRSIGLQPVEILKYVFLNSKTFSFLLKKFTDTITVKQTSCPIERKMHRKIMATL